MINIKVIRAGIDPLLQDIEVLWLNRRSSQRMITPLSDDAIGPFAQAVPADTRIWHNISSGRAAALLERLGASHICGRVERGRIEARLSCSSGADEPRIAAQLRT
jgi:hypothetical protein